MKNINCEHPVIIKNPYLIPLLLQHKCYHIRDIDRVLSETEIDLFKYSFPHRLFSAKINNIGFDDIDNCYIYNRYTGETYPMYLVVPCGKCIFCRDKKAREWQFRATCENRYSASRPIFVTLTYNNEHLPSNGLQKRDIQLFMKRLRKVFSEKGESYNIRYFACGEYGSKYGRPHYHLIFWNFPLFRTAAERLSVIQKAWSIYVGNDANNKAIYNPIGFCYVGDVEKGAISYVMKYMRKENVHPDNQNDTFYLSSRRNGGLGYKYAMEMCDYYRNNPDQLEISVFDKYSNQTFSTFIPQYFRNIFYPTLSKVVDREIKMLYEEYCYRVNECNAINFTLSRLGERLVYNCDIVNRELLKKYSFYPCMITQTIPQYKRDQLFKVDPFTLRNRLTEHLLHIRSIENTLGAYSVDEELLSILQTCRELRKQSMTDRFINEEELDLESIKNKLKYRQKLAQIREIL